MNFRALTPVAVVAALVAACSVATQSMSGTSAPSSGGGAMAYPQRAVRRDIPMTNMIRKAHAAGTRDSTGKPGRNYWQLWNEYTIAAKFDAPTAMVTGHERVVVHNNSPDSMRTIQWRLDQNLFAANVPKAEKVTEVTEGMKLTKLVVGDEVVDLAARGGRGGGGRGRGGAGGGTGPTASSMANSDVTSATLTLMHPIPPHGTGTVEIDWNFKIPRSDGVRGIRMGSWGDSLFQVGQWYPRVAVYDDLRGWDTDPYLGPSEFYNNFGHFDYTIDMPAGWLVGASGILQNPDEVLTPTARERLSHILQSDSQRTIVGADERGAGKSTLGTPGSRVTWHFIADSVADVAWTTSDRFVFDATRANIPGRGYIPYYLFYEPGNAGGAGAPGGGAGAPGGGGNGRGGNAAAAAAAPSYRGPFDVCAPGGGNGRGGGGGGGGGGRGFRAQGATGRHALEFYSRLWMPYAFPTMTQVDGPEGGMEYPMFIMAAGSTDHETGHQWWPMMVGVNETWYGFMDEGFNQYMNRLSAADRAGTQPSNDCQGRTYGNTSGNEREAPLMWDANYGGPQYSFQAYSKAPLMLSMLGGVVGDSAVWNAMSGYAKTWRFRHPSPWDYMFYMNNALHKDLGWFWYYWLFTTESVDGSIQSATTSGTQTTVTVREDGQMPSPVTLGFQFAPTGAPIKLPANAKMIDSMNVLVTLPVDVWFGGSKTVTNTFDFGGRAITRITFDPYGRYPDHDVTDNVWPRK